MSWAYDGGDVGIRLFDACLRGEAPLTFRPGMRVLDLACQECDWLERAQAAWPDVEFIGVDNRADTKKRPSRRTGNALDPELFAPGSFDAIVSLSAIEHMGLGHYGDPVDPDGDTRVMAHARTWLRPSGWMYFDVPYDPTGYRQFKTKCRIYDAATLRERLIGPTWRLQWIGYATHADADRLVPTPTEPVSPWHYVACVVHPSSPETET